MDLNLKEWHNYNLEEKEELLMEWILCNTVEIQEEEISALRNILKTKSDKIFKILLADYMCLGYGSYMLVKAIREFRIDEVLNMVENFDYRKCTEVENIFVKNLVDNYNNPKYIIPKSYYEIQTSRVGR